MGLPVAGFSSDMMCVKPTAKSIQN